MTSLRRHALTLLSVLLALAVGVALGAGPLQRDADATTVGRSGGATAGSQRLEAEVAVRRRDAAVADAFIAAAAPRLLGRSLQGRVVSVLALPTAPRAEVVGLERLVRVAGGTVGGSLQLGTGLVGVAGKQLVDQLGSQLQRQAPGVRVAAGADPYARIGALLARSVTSVRRGGAVPDRTSTGLLAGLASARLLTGQAGLQRRGDLVLVVTGTPAGGPSDSAATATIVGSLVAALRRGSAGAVLSGPAASGGPLHAVRTGSATSRSVSTVDTLGTAAGRVVTVMALAAAAGGRTGHYGTAVGRGFAIP